LEILAELVFRPLLEPQEIEKERGVIIEEIKMYNDQPMAKVALDFETLLYGQTALGWETVGTPATISQIQRTDFLTYLEQWYQPKNMVMAIAGAVSPQAPSLAEKYFLLPSQEIRERKTGFKPLAFFQQQPKLHFRFKKTEQAHFCLGVRAFKRSSKKRYALAVLATILGGNMSSRLFMEIREKRGLAYYVKTSSQLYLG
jgi:predicted Zn-dependent peptidase